MRNPKTPWRICLGFVLAASLVLAGACSGPHPATPAGRHFDTVAIQGTPRFSDQVESALTLLRLKSPQGYAIVTNHVAVIHQATHSGMRADETPPVFDLNDRSAFASVTWCAGAIAHDSFHAKLYHDYRREHRWPVPPSVWTGHDAEAKCLAHQVQVLRDLGAPASEVNYCETIKPDYADVPYPQRNW